MNAFFRMSDADFVFACPLCNEQLVEDEDDFVLTHPDKTNTFFEKNAEPIDCPNAGKRYQMPSIKLQEL